MHYVILTLAAALIGISVGALLGQRNKAILIGSVAGIALGIATLFTASWHLLALGTLIYLVAQAVQRDTPSRV